MKILNAEFIRSCVGPEQFPTGPTPEIAFVGRSNVGKSSLINALVGHKGLARTSNTPGRTQELNYFVPDGYSGEAGDLPLAAPGNGELRARRVVLAQAADALEEPAAGGVVEVLRRKRLAGAGEAFEDVPRELRLG